MYQMSVVPIGLVVRDSRVDCRRAPSAAGLLIKDAEALERLEKVSTIVVDKTGTLTEGRPSLQGVISAGGHDEARVLGLAAAVESSSEHPLGRAIVEGAKARGVDIPACGLLLSLIIASLAMSLSSVSVVSNALRLRTTRL
jgi:P-type E1-E2 ATPase